MSDSTIPALSPNTAPAATDLTYVTDGTNEWKVTLANLVTAALATGLVVSPYSFQRNKLINGGFGIDQRNNGAVITPINQQFLCDRWLAGLTASGKFSAQQSTNSTTVGLGFPYYQQVTSLGAYSVAAGDAFYIRQGIEANNLTDLALGTSGAKAITISFWAISTLTGTFGGSFQSGGSTRAYPFSFSLPNASTWTYCKVTIPGDTAGTWINSGNGLGGQIFFGLGVGSTYSGTAGAWASGDYIVPTGSVSVVGQNGAIFAVSNVQLESGSVATPFEQRQYGTELSLCQRYCYVWNALGGANAPVGAGLNISGGTQALYFIPYPVPMRTIPLLTVTGLSNFIIFAETGNVTPTSAGLDTSGTASGMLLLGSGGGLTAGQGCLMIANATTCQLIFNAEI
jgi:hypothetical protein